MPTVSSTSTSAIAAPRPPPASMASALSSGRGGRQGSNSLGATVTSNRAMLQTINEELDASRIRHQLHQEARVRSLHEKDVKRSQLVEEQHSARRSTMTKQLAALDEEECASHRMRHRLQEQQQEKVMALKYGEIERRREFSSRRSQRISQQDATAEELRVAVYHTPSPTRSPRNVSPPKMSREVAERVLLVGTIKRDPNEPMHSKEALLELQKQRDVQVEQQRIVQQQQLLEKKRVREDHLSHLKGRLDDIVRNAREENERRLRRKREEEERIGAWRWKKQHELRAEAIDRLTAVDDHGGGGTAVAPALPRRTSTGGDRHADGTTQEEQQQREEVATNQPQPISAPTAEPPPPPSNQDDDDGGQQAPPANPKEDGDDAAPISVTAMTADEL